jgi:hypothetical protein
MSHAPPISDELVPPFLDLLLELRKSCGGDLDKHIILVAIAERAVRHPATRDISDDSRLDGSNPVLPNSGVNASSIADSCGIPRETARRKVAGLLSAGWIARSGRNLAFTTDGYRALTPAREALVRLAVQSHSIVQRRQDDS